MARTYDEYLGQLFVEIGDRALERLGASNPRLCQAVIAAATVSAHWLLSDDEELDGRLNLSQVMRVRFATAEMIDRDAVEWTIGICAIVLALAYVPNRERGQVVTAVASALSLGASLEGAAREIAAEGTSSSCSLPSEVTPQLICARSLILDGCAIKQADSLEPLMLLIMIAKFGSFFDGASAR